MGISISALVAILISLLFIGFFAGIEIAFVSANKLSLELKKKQGTYSGKIWGNFAEHPARFIGTMLVVVNILLVVYGLLIGQLLAPLWDQLRERLSPSLAKYVYLIKLLFETIASTLIILMVEFLSKALFRARNNSILSNGFITYIVQFFNSIFSSVASLFVSIAEWMLQYLFNVKINDRKEVFSKVDLEHYLQQNKMHNEEESSDINKELFENALSLGDVRLRECLVPRKEIIGVSENSSIEEIKKLFIETRLSKLVIYDKNIDNITGYIHQLDLFKSPSSIKEILLPIPTVPETMSATDLMTKFSKERKTIAWVIDEFGGTAGIVTMEDLLEEIFGEIKDEYDDVEDFVDKQLAENEYLFGGRMELDLITEKYGIEFPEDENAETLSGFIVQHNADIPKEKEQIIIGNYEFNILSMSDTRIETVKMKVLRRS
ncbi:MAG: hemolysin family protein [Ferruginibacter sp.]|nr:hemolysin family protein [Ferruginibacter sp.]